MRGKYFLAVSPRMHPAHREELEEFREFERKPYFIFAEGEFKRIEEAFYALMDIAYKNDEFEMEFEINGPEFWYRLPDGFAKSLEEKGFRAVKGRVFPESDVKGRKKLKVREIYLLNEQFEDIGYLTLGVKRKLESYLTQES